MINIHKRNTYINDLLKHSYIGTKIYLYFSSKSAGSEYDSYEKNYTYTNTNPQVIRGYVRDIKSESLVWRQYGISEVGAKEILCEDKFAEWFRLCNKITIDSDEYQVYKTNVGNRMLIEKRPLKLVRIVVSKMR